MQPVGVFKAIKITINLPYKMLGASLRHIEASPHQMLYQNLWRNVHKEKQNNSSKKKKKKLPNKKHICSCTEND